MWEGESDKWLEIGLKCTQTLKKYCPLHDSTMYCLGPPKSFTLSGQNSAFPIHVEQ